MTILKFTKMHGLGNDFVIFDQRSNGYGFTKDEVVKIVKESNLFQDLNIKKIIFIKNKIINFVV